MSSTYLVAVGSNMRHHIYGAPRDVVRAAMEECSALGTVTARSPIIRSVAMGAAQRRFANAACLIESEYDPQSLLAGLKRVESEFGRRSGQRWGNRVLDLDIILWSAGIWRSKNLAIPHIDFRGRDFVLTPAKAIAADWRDPLTGLTVQHLSLRNKRSILR